MTNYYLLIFTIFLVIMNLITFVLYFIDKRRAIKNKWRIKESILLLWTILFGSIGALCGIYGLRHKTKHWYFPFTAIFSLLVQSTIIIYLMFIL